MFVHKFTKLFFALLMVLISLVWVSVGSHSAIFAQTDGIVRLFSCTDVTEIPLVECEALVALYESTDSDNWHDSVGRDVDVREGWLQTNTPCSWVGVRCTDGHVVELDKKENSLSGVIPAEIGNLTHLTALGLRNNQLTSIPPEIENPINLVSLDLGDNQFTTVPAEIVTLLNLDNGGIFVDEGVCVEAAAADVEVWSNITGITKLQPCSNSSFSCDFIIGISTIECEAVVALYNSTNGADWALNIGWMQTNTPCFWHGLTCEQDQVSAIVLHDNNLQGILPVELTNLSSIKTLSLFRNSLEGNLPAEWSALTTLENLLLHGNNFTGEIPSEFGLLSNLQSLDVSSNQLTGELPATLSNTSLTSLSVSNNPDMYGKIPETYQALALEALHFQGSDICEPDSLQDWMATISELDWARSVCQDNLLNIQIAAFDNNPKEGNLSTHYLPMLDNLLAASEGEANKTSLILIDLDQRDDTHILLVHNGFVTNVVGLPNTNGELDTTINEYDMTDGAQLGGFLKWAMTMHVNRETKTTLSYVGHGTFLAPDTDYSTIFPATDHDDPTSESDGNGLDPLPLTTWFTDGVTDVNPKRSMITPYALQQMLAIGTNDGANPLDVLDITHCFAASVEELYEVANADGTPYAEMIVGSPSYAYFAPEMFGSALARINPNSDAQTIAIDLMTAYDDTIAVYDTLDGNAVTHPRVLHVYDSALIPVIKDSMDALSNQTMVQFDSDPVGMKDHLSDAYAAAGLYYDTTYCSADWAMSAPDALVDMSAFMQAIAAEFGTGLGSIGFQALQVQAAVQNSIIESRAHDGTPWFAGSDAPTWTFAGSTMSLYADLAGVANGADGADGNERTLAWQGAFYTDTVSSTNPHPHRFTQDRMTSVTWADVLARYWQVKTQDEGLTITRDKDACLPTPPPLPDDGELTAVGVNMPLTGTLRVNAPTLLQGVIRTTRVAVNPTVQFNVYDSDSTLVYSDTVGAGYLIQGTHGVVSSRPFTAATADEYTVEMIIDPDNHFDEGDEGNNSVSRSDTAYDLPVLTMDINVAGDSQWVGSDTVDLEITTNHTLNWLVVHVYQYTDTEHPHGQMPMLIEEIPVLNPSQPIHTLRLPSNLQAGHVTLHVWGVAGASLSNPHAIVEFNYAPSSLLADVGDAHYYIFHAEAGDTVQVVCALDNGGANMLIWQPNNYWSAQKVNCSDTIDYQYAMSGEYVVKVTAASADSRYSIMGSVTGTNDGSGSSTRRAIAPDQGNIQSNVMATRPGFIAPISGLEVVRSATADPGEPNYMPAVLPNVPMSVLQGEISSPSSPSTMPLIILALCMFTVGTWHIHNGTSDDRFLKHSS